jgi:hypothetical protein
MMHIVDGSQIFKGSVDIEGAFHGGTSTIVGVATSAPADGDLNAGECGIWVDETGDTLNFKVKYSDGVTIKSGSIALS